MKTKDSPAHSGSDIKRPAVAWLAKEREGGPEEYYAGFY